MATRSTSPSGRPRVGRPAAACLWFLMILGVGGGVGAPRAEGAVNASVTIQLLWQVQQGCAVRCTGSSQTQTAVQTATVLQVAAGGGDAGAGSGVAVNASAVVQLIVQTQLGCVAFCVGTTRVQSATQRADATQLASVLAGALAANSATVSQVVWQYQDACAEACDDVSATQVVEQAAATVQAAGSASASASGDGAALATSPPVPPELQSFLVWLASVAGQAVVDVVEQRDEAACLADCAGDVQVQIGVQEARVVQTSVDEDVTAEPGAVAVRAGDAPAASAEAVVPVAPRAAASAATAVAVAPRRAAPKRRVARRPGHRGRRSVTRHRRSLTGGVHRAR